MSAEQRAKREWLAGEILKVTNDPNSLGFYRKVAAERPSGHFSGLSELRRAVRETNPSNRGAHFVSLNREAVILLEVRG